MEMTEQRLSDMWDELIALVDEYIESPRKEALIALYEKYQDRVATAPASGKVFFHNAFVGGYLDHVLTVTKNAIELYEFFRSHDITVEDFGLQEVVFCALNHDLGKLGDDGGDYYIPATEDWHRRRGETFLLNPKIHYMDVSNRALFLLNQAGIRVSQIEWLGLLLADGLYEERKNQNYYMTYEEGKQLKTNLPYLIHFADMMATRAEADRYRKEKAKLDAEYEAAQAIQTINPRTAPKKAKSDPQKRNAQLKDTFTKFSKAQDDWDKLFQGAQGEKEK